MEMQLTDQKKLAAEEGEEEPHALMSPRRPLFFLKEGMMNWVPEGNKIFLKEDCISRNYF